jgi:hypothetical protein
VIVTEVDLVEDEDSRVMIRAGTVPEGLIVRWVGVDCSSRRRLMKIGVKGMFLRWRAMRRRAEQEERKYV